MRKALPNRRRSESRRVKWRSPLDAMAPENTIHITVGYDEDGLTPREIFYDGGYKSGSDLETLASDICILLSIFLQHDGVVIEDFAKSLAYERNRFTDQKDPASIVGVLVEQLRQPPAWAGALTQAADGVGP